MMKAQGKLRGGVILIALLLVALFGFSMIVFSAQAENGENTYDLKTGLMTYSKAKADSDVNLKTAFDRWKNAKLSFTDDGILADTKGGNGNAFNICGVFSLRGDGIQMEINFPLHDPNAARNAFIDDAYKKDNSEIVLYNGSTEVAKIVLWGDNYPKNNNAYIAATITVGGKNVTGIQIPKCVVEEGGFIKIGFTKDTGWGIDILKDDAVVYSTSFTTNSDYLAAVASFAYEEVTRISIKEGAYGTGANTDTKVLLRSLNKTSLRLVDDTLTLDNTFFYHKTTPIMQESNDYQIGEKYLFELVSMEASDVPNLTKTKTNPNAKLYMKVHLADIGDVGWTNGTDKGIYWSVIDPNGQKTTKQFERSWGTADQVEIAFIPTMCGTHTVEVTLLTVNGFLISRSIEVFVMPTTVVLDGVATVAENTITLPTALAGDAMGNTVDNGEITITAECDEQAVIVADGTIVDAKAGAYTVTYGATVNGMELPEKTYEFYYDGTQIITDTIAVSGYENDMILTENTVSGTGGTIGTNVTVQYGDQTALKAEITKDGWTATLQDVTEETTGALVITYGAQSFTYTGVRRGVIYTVTTTGGEHGTVNSDVETVAHGGTVIFTVTADEGYRVCSVQLNGVDKTLSDGRLTVEDVTTNLTLTVVFEEIPQPVVYTVTVNAGQNGTVTPSATTVEEGGSVVFTVTANEGYTVESIQLNGVEKTLTNGQLTVDEVHENITLTVTFKVIEQIQPQPAPTPDESAGCGGCGSAIGGSTVLVALLFLGGATVVASRKRKS